MSKSDYGTYTTSIVFILAITSVVDSSVQSNLTTGTVRYRNDPTRLGRLKSAAVAVKILLTIPIAIVSISAISLVLLKSGVPNLQMVTIGVLTLGTILLAIPRGVLDIVLRIEGRFVLAQSCVFVAAICRVALVVSIFLVGANLSAPLALLFFFIEASGVTLLLIKASRRSIAELHPAKNMDTASLWSNARQTLPMNLANIGQTQFIYLCVILFGSLEVAGELGAFSRLNIVFAVVSVFAMNVGGAIVARAAGDLLARRLVRRFLTVFLIVGLIFVISIALGSSRLIQIFGSEYNGLEVGMVIISAGGVAINFVDVFRTFNQSRGWLDGSNLYLPAALAWAAGGFLVDFSNIEYVAWWLSAICVPGLIAQGTCYLRGGRSREGAET